MGENEDILVAYGVVSNLMITMTDLASDANSLQVGLTSLESDIRTYYGSADTENIIQNYGNFMDEMTKIKQDIDSVNAWCQQVVSTMKSVEEQNAEDMARVTALQG